MCWRGEGGSEGKRGSTAGRQSGACDAMTYPRDLNVARPIVGKEKGVGLSHLASPPIFIRVLQTLNSNF